MIPIYYKKIISRVVKEYRLGRKIKSVNDLQIGIVYNTIKNDVLSNNPEIIKLFYKFLTENSAFDGYFQNMILANKRKDYVLSLSPFNYIDSAFAWFSTKEQYYYWKKLNHMWTEILYEKYPILKILYKYKMSDKLEKINK